MVSKYIYFAANNMVEHPLYMKSFILGETEDINVRQHQYNVMQKGIQQIPTGTLTSIDGQDGLIFPFVDYFKLALNTVSNAKNRHDTFIHDIMLHERPFKDLVYHVKDKLLMNTKEAFAFYNTSDFIRDIERIKDFLIENLTSYGHYTVMEYKFT